MATPAYSRETRNLLYLSRPRRQGSPAYETVAFLQVSRADDRLLAHLASLTPSGTLIQETFLLRCVSSMCLESLSCHLESRTVTLECNFGKAPSHQCCVLPRRAYRVKGSILLQDFYVAKHRDFTFTLTEVRCHLGVLGSGSERKLSRSGNFLVNLPRTLESFRSWK